MKRVAIYARVSTEEQSRNGLSIQAQLQELRKYVLDHNYKLIDEYVDAGISARKSYKKRPELLRLLKDVENDNLDIILFIKLDRWFRNVQNYYEVQAILDAHNVAWQATMEDYETVTASGRFKVNIMLSVAQDEADRTAERIKFVFEGKRERNEPTWGKQLWGYKLEDKVPSINEEEAIKVKAMFEKYIDCRSITYLQKWLYNEYGIQRSCKGIRNLLTNTSYIGKQPIYNFPSIIDKETFVRVQEILQDRSQRYNRGNEHLRTYLFVGMTYCKDCGGRYKSQFSTSGHTYYVCNKHSRFGKNACKNNKHIREEYIEQFLLDNLIDVIKDRNAKIIKTETPKIDENKIKKKMEKLKDLYLNDLISREIYEADYRSLESELNSIVPIQKEISINYVEEMLKLYNISSAENKKAFWGRVIKRIEIGSNKEISFIPN